jgi:hypothetical protein
MAKYLKLPITGVSSPSVTIGIDMIATVERNAANATTKTEIHYSTGTAANDTITLTHSTVSSTEPLGMRDALQDAIVNLHSSNWRETIQTLNLASVKTDDGSLMAITAIVLT